MLSKKILLAHQYTSDNIIGPSKLYVKGFLTTASKFDPENRFRTKKFSDKIRFNRLLRECGH